MGVGTGRVDGETNTSFLAVGNWYRWQEGRGIWSRPRIMRPWEELLASQNGSPGGPGGMNVWPQAGEEIPSCL